MKLGPALLLCSVIVAALPVEGRADLSTEFEAGQQLSYGFDQSEFTRKRFYLSGKTEQVWEIADGTLGVNASLRGFIEAPGQTAAEADVRSLSIVLSKQRFRTELGFQEIPWGETFGFYIADIVNPRDFRDALFNEMAWARLAVFAWNTQIFLERLTLQFVLTPVPRLNRLPDSVIPASSFGVADFRNAAEYGGRASYLFESGLDLGLIYFRHWNRTPALLLASVDPATGAFTFSQVASQVDTVGLTASQASGDWVFRMDSVLHLDQPETLSAAEEPRTSSNWQMILGADWTDSEGGNWGVQYHLDQADRANHWVSGMVRRSFQGRKWEAECFAFKGLGNADLWIQPRLTWYLNDSVSWSLRSDLLTGSGSLSEGALSSFSKQDRVLSWISFRF